MRVARAFLGWDTPVAEAVRKYLLPDRVAAPPDLADTLILVPTRQAGRRLRESLARHCAESGTGVLSPQIQTPPALLRPARGSSAVEASPTLSLMALAHTLRAIEPADFGGLFPTGVARQDTAWSLDTAAGIHALRARLIEAGLTISEFVAGHGETLEEAARWRDLARIEEDYLASLAGTGYRDPCECMRAQAGDPELPAGTVRVVVASVPDPSPLAVRALTRVAERVQVEILVHAPESHATAFDAWGRPDPAYWSSAEIDIPEAAESIVLASAPRDQAHAALRRLARTGTSAKPVCGEEVSAAEPVEFGIGDVAFGIPDAGVAPFLAAALRAHGLSAFDPGEKALREHPTYRLLQSATALHEKRAYPAFSAFLRQPDVLAALAEAEGVQAAPLLAELDEFQNAHLPCTVSDIADRLARSESAARRYPVLRRAVTWTEDHVLAILAGSPPADALRTVLATVYARRTLRPDDPADQEFVKAADLVARALRELSDGAVQVPSFSAADLLLVLQRRLGAQRYAPDRIQADTELEGWLELAWNAAPLLVVTGMNEGLVPDTRTADMFLPDSVCERLGLRCNATRLARDAFLMTTMIESRRNCGGACFIAGKTSAGGDPLRPSRLLLRCAEPDFLARAERLFGPAEDMRVNVPATAVFKLDPSPPPDLGESARGLGRLSVTAFRDYLACPFRFYLKHILGMSELDDHKKELDALDFGILIHAALDAFARDPGISESADTDRIATFLVAQAEREVRRTYGADPALPVRIALEAATQRLRAAAAVQAGMAAEGWRVLRSEQSYEADLCGLRVTGRIDRHADTGALRVIDYKTSDTGVTPAEAHFDSVRADTPDFVRVSVQGKERRWRDLQLPLYHALLSAGAEFGEPLEPAYFNLPKAVGETGLAPWPGLDAELLASARACAEDVVRRIRDEIYWPPAARVTYDDFERLFPRAVPECVTADAFDERGRLQGRGRSVPAR